MSATDSEMQSTAATVAWARRTLKLTYREIGVVLHADERSVRRWEGGTVRPRGHHRARVEQLRDCRELLHAVFESTAAAVAWLHTSMRGLQGQTPIAVIRQGGVGPLVGILATLESGAYS